MATITKTVDQGGTGNYLTLKDLCDDQAGLTGGVLGGDVLKIVCKSTNGIADPGGADFGVFTTTAAGYVWLYVDPDYRPHHKWETGNKFRVNWTAPSDGTRALDIDCDHMRIDGLYLVSNGTYDCNLIYIHDLAPGGYVYIDGCLFRSTVTGSGNYCRGIRDASIGTLRISNSIFYDFNTTNNSCAGIYTTSGSAYAYNCTAVDCYFGFATGSGVMKAFNCGTQGCVDGFWGTFATGSDYNASDISSDAPGSNSRNGTSGEVTFKDASGNDFALAQDDTNWRGKGTDPADTNFPITEDIDGNKRIAWDIGACEFLAAAGNIEPSIVVFDGVCTEGEVNQAAGDIQPPIAVFDGTAFIDHIARGNIEPEIALFKGYCSIDEPQELPTVVGYETFPLRAGMDHFEGFAWKTRITPPEAGATVTGQTDERPERLYRLTWAQRTRILSPLDAEKLRSFYRAHVGPSRPFYYGRPDPIARPWYEPSLSLRAEGWEAARTVYVGYTWAGDAGETQISLNIATLSVPANHQVDVILPRFPTNVTRAHIYIGASADLLYKQAQAVSQSGGTWLEPSGGYVTGTSLPPSSNTLAETLLVTFREYGYKLRQVSAVAYEGEALFREAFRTVVRAHYASGNVQPGIVTFDGTCVVPVQIAHGDIEPPIVVFDGTATYTPPIPDQENVEGDIEPPMVTISGVCTLAPRGDLFVAKTGSDSNDGSYGNPFLTIQKGLNTAVSGQTIVVQSGTYQENLSLSKSRLTLRGVGYPIVDGNGGSYCLESLGLSDETTIDKMAFRNAYRGVKTTEDNDWLINECKVYQIDRDGIRLLKGRRHRVLAPQIYEIGNHDEAMGIKVDGCTSCLVEGGSFWLVRKNGVRLIRGSANTVVRNHFQACGTGPVLNYNEADALVRNNYTYKMVRGGFISKHSIGGAGYNRCLYNTFEESAWGGLVIGINVQVADYVEMRRNIIKQTLGDTFFFTADSALGPHIILDENLYWEISPGPARFARLEDWNGGSHQYADTLAEFQALVASRGWAENAVLYDSGYVNEYGATGYATPPKVYYPRPATIHSASRNVSQADDTTDWRIYTAWNSDGVASNQWIIYDLGSEVSMNCWTLKPHFNDGKEPKNILIQTSNSASGPWDTRVDDVVQVVKVSPNYWAISSSVTARYVRLYMTDNYGGSEVEVALFETGEMV